MSFVDDVYILYVIYYDKYYIYIYMIIDVMWYIMRYDWIMFRYIIFNVIVTILPDICLIIYLVFL
jgi:hypothetical protein